MTSSTATAPRVRSFSASDLAYVAVFAALLAALSLAPAIPVGAIGVPITLQTLGVALCGLCLGPWRGFAAAGLYVVAGLAGLPIFAGGKAGLGVLAGPSLGYLIAFPLAALFCGFVARWAVRRGLSSVTPLLLLAAVLASRYLVTLPLAVVGFMLTLGLDLRAAVVADMPFWIGDFVKAVVAALLAFAVHKAFPRLLGR
ncbi:biotin transporter BioY [Tessaracoccus sp. OS52]|uniref:biotin transporter BioY n=1 Tax=Tessaracoccus sp. OS52 TaxID=2886691 RepID=UPI001D120663|nr:biotin transporter BioY [Tessaracoccus sp. OS52]MCC2593358.1 biotin transporter BioY [Tessaracoccus sp. OS52]